MRKSLIGWGLGMAVVFIVSAGLKADDKVEAELKKFQGTWSHPSSNGGKDTYAFEGRKLKVVAPTRTYMMTVTIDPEAKPEKTIEFKVDEGPDDARSAPPSKGIYKFEGDKLIWCYRPGGDRPAKYEQIGVEQILSELTRDTK